MNAKCIKIFYVDSEYLHDALPTLGTSPAVRVMRDLVLSGQADEVETDIWFTSMSFIADPTQEMIADVKVKKTWSVCGVDPFLYSYSKHRYNINSMLGYT